MASKPEMTEYSIEYHMLEFMSAGTRSSRHDTTMIVLKGTHVHLQKKMYMNFEFATDWLSSPPSLGRLDVSLTLLHGDL